ncbi:hypothetical protein D3C87_1888760 [compost metagenome]
MNTASRVGRSPAKGCANNSSVRASVASPSRPISWMSHSMARNMPMPRSLKFRTNAIPSAKASFSGMVKNTYAKVTPMDFQKRVSSVNM